MVILDIFVRECSIIGCKIFRYLILEVCYMNKLKKGLVIGLLVSAVALTAVFSGHFKNAKADNIESTGGTGYERNTNLSVDASGKLQVKRNELGNEPMGKEGTWTVFVYMCGSDLETNYNSASTDIKEMISASESDKVNIVIQTGGANAWNKPAIEADRIGRYIIKDNRLDLIESHPDANMGDGATLKSFLSWGINTQLKKWVLFYGTLVVVHLVVYVVMKRMIMMLCPL